MLDQGVEVFKEVNNTPKENRTWTLSLIINILCIVGATIYGLICNTNVEEAKKAQIKAETQLLELQNANIRDAKDCPKAIRDAEEKLSIYYQEKFDRQEEFYRDKTSNLENKYDGLQKELEQVKSKVDNK